MAESANPPPKKRGRKPALDTELVAASLVELRGNIAAVARKFSVDRHTVRSLIDARPNLQQILTDAREGMLDDAENALYEAVIAREAWAVCFFLKTQGKARGYTEKPEADARDSLIAELLRGHVRGDVSDRAGTGKQTEPPRETGGDGPAPPLADTPTSPAH